MNLFASTEEFKRAHCGFYVQEINGKEICQLNADQYFIPASLQKIPISACALHLLEEDHCFHTDLEYEGLIDKEGVLHGDLWIQGGGDPTFSLDVLLKWEEELKCQNIQTIHGKIKANPSCFETRCASPYWSFEDLGNYYGAGASGLSVNHNQYTITFKPGEKENDPTTVVNIDPLIPDLVIHNEVRTGPAGSGDLAWVFGSEYSPIQFYRGTIPIDEPTFTIKASIPNPAALCAEIFARKLKPSKGAEVVLSASGSKRERIARHSSVPIRALIKEMNLHSINLYAEHLLKTLGNGVSEVGTKRVEKTLESWGISAQIKDGAGLARNNLISPKGFVKLLCKMRISPYFQSFCDSLPQPGGEGTLQNFPPLAKGSFRAKTGGMSQIFNLGGYLYAPGGKEYAFAIFCNHFVGPLSKVEAEMAGFLKELLN